MKSINLTAWRWWRIDVSAMAACVAAAALVYFLGVDPLFRRHREAHDLEVQLGGHLKESRSLSDSLRQLQARQTEVTNALADSPLRLRTVEQTNGQLARIAELATECGLKVHEIQPGGIVHGTRYEVVPIQLSGRGAHSQCIEFLRQLKRTLPDTGAVGFQLHSIPSPSAGSGFRVDLEWYAAPVGSN